MNIFRGETEHSWIHLPEIEAEQIELWNATFTKTGIDRDHATLPFRLVEIQRQEQLNKEKSLIVVAKEEVDSLSKTISNPHLIIFTNLKGVALAFTGPENIVNILESVNVGLGTSFALEHAGINAISLSMQLDALVAVQGLEHSMTFFSKWNCMCSPIKLGNELRGFLNISVSLAENLSFVASLLKRLISDIESRMMLADPMSKQALIYEHFDLFSLTKREKEIGFGWLQNQSALQISLALGITEATVRHTLKKVYSKTKCHDRGGFIKKFFV
ncbi:helix-turn-helix transcriptional regulator [Paenibacillus alba]|uniref:LuxR C-terminal-related transcriptional regulator n=1 Tax=Paenibacillus alba TaxID=1197127 RepID=A0ABU6G037_9BACL|nr:LuxR C-terminal-related transcriptional regulator [Paenibacillus alba]MEC0227510.1 LuxR C-terminal-related transcriptional regulator [Paenibacillus alba]